MNHQHFCVLLIAYASPRESKDKRSDSATSAEGALDLPEADACASAPHADFSEAEPAMEAMESNFGPQSNGITTTPGSDTESFEEVSESDLAALAALSVHGASSRDLLQPEADQVTPMVCSVPVL